MRTLPLLLLLAWVLAQEVYHPTATLVRKGKEVVVEKTSPDDVGLAWIEEKEKGVLFIFYDPPPYRVVVRFGKDALAYASLALVDQPDAGGGKIELTAGTASYNPKTDHAGYQVKEIPDAVEIEKGRFRAYGTRLEYRNEEGIAYLKGPTRFERSGEKVLKGTAGALLYLVDEDRVWLTGGIALTQGDRTTRAQTALIDEAGGRAWLFGNPVKSVARGERVEGARVNYDLETGAIWVIEGIRGNLTDASPAPPAP